MFLFSFFLKNFNISDTRCVHLKNNFNDKTKIFEWNRDSCVLTTHNPTSAICECYASGSFSITNDLYDPSVSLNLTQSQHSSDADYVFLSFKWMPIIIENIPLNLPAYFGCIIVSFLAVATFACLTYLKTKSVTTSIHKNLCIGVCVSQLLIIVSLSQIEFGEVSSQILTKKASTSSKLTIIFLISEYVSDFRPDEPLHVLRSLRMAHERSLQPLHIDNLRGASEYPCK